MQAADALTLAVELGKRLVATAPKLDAPRVRALMVETMGEDDERVRAWDDIARRFAPS